MENNSSQNDQIQECRVSELDIKHDEDQVNALLKELAADKEELLKSQDRVIELLTQIEKATRENKKLREKASELNKRDQQILKLQQKLDTSEKQAAKLEMELKKTRDIVNKDSVQDLNLQLSESKKTAASLEKVLAKSQRMKKLDDSKLIELKKVNDTAAQRNLKLCDKLEVSTQRVQKLNDEAKSKTRRIKEVFDIFDESNSKRNQLVLDLAEQGDKHSDMKQFEEASEFWLKAVEVDMLGTNDSNELGTLWSNITFSFYQLKRYEEALEAIERSIECGALNAMRFYVRGMIQKELGKQSEAIADLDKSLNMDPNHSRAEHAKEILAELKNEEQ